MADTRRVLVVDNHDSFVHTLVGYLVELGASCDVVEADDVTDAHAAIRGFAGVLISPGPGRPSDAGASIDVVRAAASQHLPLLGVCLGHQALAEAFGATVAHAPELLHGITSPVHHDGAAIFDGLPDPFDATRYHSLAVVRSTLSDELAVTAETASGVVMGLAHTTLPLTGVQFHPESVLTDGGYRLLGNWLETVGVDGAAARGARLRPHRDVDAAHVG
ncbi:MAG: aminodeoxychorismate/anthranilate synthase component II [Microbacterium sp.]|nr:MAG: aminodeoxychorismate/anthranilate synthase component II [Microbacterium sp.]